MYVIGAILMHIQQDALHFKLFGRDSVHVAHFLCVKENLKGVNSGGLVPRRSLRKYLTFLHVLAHVLPIPMSV